MQFRTVTPVRAVMKTLFGHMIDPELHQKADPRILEFKEIQKHAEGHFDYYYMSTPAFPFASRDFVYTQYNVYNDTRSFVVGFSIQRNDVPPKHGVVRGDMEGK